MSEPEPTKIDSDSSLAALERFVVDNDELLELEALIGRFNIFDALRVVDVEIRHSNFLAWLLDPAESHGQGGLFLRAILMDLLKSARENGFPCPVSPIELDGEDLRGVEIRREWKHIDLLISCNQPPFVVAIENKINSGEHSNQLERYRKAVQAEFGEQPLMFVFLTVGGDEPSEEGGEGWVPYSYGQLRQVLSRVCDANEMSIGDDVHAFLNHYLRLLRGRLMDDPDIEKLCQDIYKNHRQALQLIYEHAGSPAAGLLGKIELAITERDGDWHIVNKTSKAVYFVPREWLQWMPEIGSRPSFSPRCWVVLRFEIRKTRGFYAAAVWPTTNPEIRGQVVKRLTNDREEFGFKSSPRTVSSKFTQLGGESIGRWSEDNGPDDTKVLKAVEKQLDILIQRLVNVRDALQPLLEKQ